MAENRRAQLEQWRQERLREKRPVQTTTVAVQRRVVVAAPRTSASSRGASKPTAASGHGLSAARAAMRADRNAKATADTAKNSRTATTTTTTPADRGGPHAEQRDTSLDSIGSVYDDDGDERDAKHESVPMSAEKQRKEKRRTSFILPSPSNAPALAGGAKRVLTPTRLTPPKSEDGTAAERSVMEDSDESDGGFGPSPRKKRMAGLPLRVASALVGDMAASEEEPQVSEKKDSSTDDDITKMFDEDGETETDVEARSVRTTLSFGSISRPLRVLHQELASDDEEASELGLGSEESIGSKTPTTANTEEAVEISDPKLPERETVAARAELEASEPSSSARAVPPQRGAVRVLASGTSATSTLGHHLRRTSTGEAPSRKSLDEVKPIQTLEERLNDHRKWEMEDFSVTKNLGKGKFGNVYLAKEKHSNVSVALKVLYKSPLIHEGGLKNLQREVEIQHRLLHPNLLRLFGYFYDDACIYLVLEYASHGELYKLLSKQRRFTEAFAAHYIAQVVDALEYLHGCHVIHRDIKPENLLMGANHTIKLADFGWSVHAPQQFAKRRTFCGTPDYLSPEILLGEEYDHRVDVWSVGVLAYEFLFGSTPFHVDNQMEMYKRIETVDFQFPSEPAVSDVAKRFISSLLQRNPDDRMTLRQARKHEWLAERPSI